MIAGCIKVEVDSSDDDDDGTPEQRTNNPTATVSKICLAEVLVPRASPSSMNENRNVVIVMDALRDFSWQPLLWTLNHVLKSGCSVTLLGVMPYIPLALSCKTWSNVWTCDLEDLSALKGRNELKSDLKYQKIRGIIELCERKGVVPYIKVAIGHHLKLVVLEKTTKLHACLVVLDRHMRKNKSFFAERLPSSVVMMNSDGGVDMVKIQSTINSCDSSPEQESPASPATPLPTQVIISKEWAELIDCHKAHQRPSSSSSTKSQCRTHESLFTRTKREWDNCSGKWKAMQ